jgi:hypothetical protein
LPLFGFGGKPRSRTSWKLLQLYFGAAGSFFCLSSGMSWWNERKAVEILEIEPPIDRVTETQLRVSELKKQLDELNGMMLAFKTKNKITTDRYSRLLGVNCSDIGGREKIECEWRVLLRKRDGLVDAWHKALFAWAAAKEAAQ